jgi:hypothetical protein
MREFYGGKLKQKGFFHSVPAVKGPKPAVVFGKIGREGWRGSGNTVSSSSLQLIDVCGGCKQLIVYTVFLQRPGTN